MSSRALAAAPFAVGVLACGDVAPLRAVYCSGQPVEVLPNGSFDAATPAWTQDTTTMGLICGAPRIMPFDGTQAACLGGSSGMVQTLTQQVPLPNGAVTIKLSGQICVATTETQAVDHDILQFDLLDGTMSVAELGKITNRQGAASCDFVAFEQTAAVASDPVTATLQIRSTLNADLPTSFYVDALSLIVGCKP